MERLQKQRSQVKYLKMGDLDKFITSNLILFE